MAQPQVFSDKKLMLVVNPLAGRKTSAKKLAEVCRVLYECDWTVSVFVTAAHGEAKQLVMQRAAQFERVVCMGGDGTFNEVVSGMVQAGLDIPVGFVPCGSTNDFAKMHGLSADVKKAAQQAGGDVLKHFDVAAFNDEIITFHGAFGWFASVVNSTPQDAKNILGYAAYVLDGIKDVSALRAVQASFTLPDGTRHEGEYIYGGILSTLSLGGNIVSFPKELVRVDDGMFEVFLIRMPKDVVELSELLFLLSTGVLESKYTEFFRISEMQVRSESNMNWSLDGEPAPGDGTAADVRVLPQRLQLAGGIYE